MIHTKNKVITLCSLAALLAAGQAFSHTGVRDKVTGSSLASTNSYNGFTITHGCGGDTGEAFPVLGQSAVFPTGLRVIWRDSAGAEIDGTNIFDTRPRDHTGAVIPDVPNPGLNLGVTGYAGFGSPFTTAQEIVDPNALNPGVVEGLLWKDGAMEPKLNAITPFKVTIPAILDASVKQVNIRIGVINYCDFNKNAANDAQGPYAQPKDAFGRKIPKLTSLLAPDQINVYGAPYFVSLGKGNGDNNRQDWWFGGLSGSTLYTDPDLLQPTEVVRTDDAGNPVLDANGQPIIDQVTPYWTTLTVTNANATGAKVVSIEPTGEAFDAILTGPNTRPFTKGKSNF